MTVILDLNPEIERGLLAQARARGISLNDYLQEIVSQQARVGSPPAVANSRTLKLPVLHLGKTSSLHRRDIYDDAR